MVAEGAPDLPIRPRPSIEPLSYLSGLLSADVRQLEHAVLVVHVAGELDMLTGPPLQDHLGELLATRPDRLIIDLSQVSFMGSTGLSVLICTRQNAIAMGTTLQLSGTSARAISVPLEVTGLNQLFEILPTPPTIGDVQR
ncbi:MAG: STAS domain-containing protein [Pseudonocardiaceae bacterium]